MNLHILLDYKGPYEHEEGDVVLSSPYNPLDEKNDIIVIPFDYSIIFSDRRVIEDVNRLYSETDALFKPTRNSVYGKLLMAIYAFDTLIERVTQEYNVDKIYLYDGCRIPFVTTLNSEGEGARKDYSTNWLVNAVLYDKYCGRYDIIWKHKINASRLYVKNYFRWIKGIITILLLSLYSRVLTKKDLQNEESKKLLSIVDLPLQAYSINNLLSEKSKSISYLSLEKGCFNILIDKGYDVIHIPYLRVRKLLSIAYLVLFKKVSLSASPFGKCFDMLLKREVRLQALIYHIRLNRITEFLDQIGNKSKTILVTNMTWGTDIVSAHDAAFKTGIKHFNFQYVALGGKLFPQLELADYYYLYDKITYNLYKDYSRSFRLYLPLLKKEEERVVKKADHLRTLTIFMQPDSFAIDYLDFIESLIHNDSVKKSGWRIIIKPHYRQNLLGSLYSIVESVPFVRIAEPSESCGDILRNTDIAVSIHSAVIFEAMTNGVMCLVYSAKGKYNQTIYNTGICFADVNFVINETNETFSYMESFSLYSEEYTKRLQHFLNTNSVEVNVDDILEKAMG